MTAEHLARAMFTRRCELDGGEPALVELAWEDVDVRGFWVAEAVFVLGVLGELEAADPCADRRNGAENGRIGTAPTGAETPAGPDLHSFPRTNGG